jgi:hypothetical protein
MTRNTLVESAAWVFVFLIFALTLLFVGLSAATTNAAAQELPDQNETDTPEPDAVDTDLYDQLYSLNIHDVEFREDDSLGHVVVVEATWTGRTPQTVTVTQIPDGKDIAIERRTLRPDERTKFTIDLIDGSPAMLYTTESISQGRATKLKDNDNWLISGPWDSTDAQISAIAGLVAGLSTVSALAYRKVTAFDDEPERIL